MWHVRRPDWSKEMPNLKVVHLVVMVLLVLHNVNRNMGIKTRSMTFPRGRRRRRRRRARGRRGSGRPARKDSPPPDPPRRRTRCRRRPRRRARPSSPTSNLSTTARPTSKSLPVWALKKCRFPLCPLWSMLRPQPLVISPREYPGPNLFIFFYLDQIDPDFGKSNVLLSRITWSILLLCQFYIGNIGLDHCDPGYCDTTLPMGSGYSCFWGPNRSQDRTERTKKKT